MRLLFWVLIGLLVYFVVRGLTRGGQQDTRSRSAIGPAEDMVRCAVCGLNLPKSEALPLDGKWACCAEHARQRTPAAHP